VFRRLAIEGDDLEIRTVLKGDQNIVAAYRMPPTGNDGEAQLLVISGCLVEVMDDNDQVINSLNHEDK
jgi:hypothetical protein